MLISIVLFVVFGLLISSEFRDGFIAAAAGCIVFPLSIAVGVVFNVFYPFVMAYKLRSLKVAPRIVWRLIVGTYSSIGYMLRDGVGIGLDYLANVWGEWVEDGVTSNEETMFGEELITLSASVGHLEKNRLNINTRGKKLSKVLNVFFNQTRHALGSWEKYLAVKEINDLNLLGNKEKSGLWGWLNKLKKISKK